MDPWRPIATAPLDSTWIIVLMRNGDIFRAHFAENLSGEEQPAFSGWFVNCGGTTHREIDRPTYWIPIPTEYLHPQETADVA